MDPKELASVKITLRHETGHLIVGKSLGFPTADMLIDAEQAGQSVDIQPSLKTMQEFQKFAENRITLLYAGVCAQNLGNGGSVDRVAAEKSLVSTAKDDFSKIRELMRPLVGSKHPDVSPEEFKTHLEETRTGLFERACGIVEANASLIFDVMEFAVREVLKFEKANRGKSMKSATISKGMLDEFLHGKKIHEMEST